MNTIDLSDAQWRKSSHSGEANGCVEVATAWRKSSHSGSEGNCVEVATAWRKSSHSNGSGSCVEVGQTPARVVVVRDTQDRGGPVLAASLAAWGAFAAAVRSGQAVRSTGPA